MSVARALLRSRTSASRCTIPQRALSYALERNPSSPFDPLINHAPSHASTSTSGTNFLEDFTPEYSEFSLNPNDASQANISLREAVLDEEYRTATTLREQAGRKGVVIEPHPVFEQAAIHYLHGLVPSSEYAGRNWAYSENAIYAFSNFLTWWNLIPPAAYSSSETPYAPNLKATMNLVTTIPFISIPSLVDFGLVLARQGYARHIQPLIYHIACRAPADATLQFLYAIEDAEIRYWGTGHDAPGDWPAHPLRLVKEAAHVKSNVRRRLGGWRRNIIFAWTHTGWAIEAAALLRETSRIPAASTKMDEFVFSSVIRALHDEESASNDDEPSHEVTSLIRLATELLSSESQNRLLVHIEERSPYHEDKSPAISPAAKDHSLPWPSYLAQSLRSFRTLFRTNSLPRSASIFTAFMDEYLARTQGKTRGLELLFRFQRRQMGRGPPYAGLSLWATSEMLLFSGRGDFENTLRSFRSWFRLAGVPGLSSILTESSLPVDAEGYRVPSPLIRIEWRTKSDSDASDLPLLNPSRYQIDIVLGTLLRRILATHGSSPHSVSRIEDLYEEYAESVYSSVSHPYTPSSSAETIESEFLERSMNLPHLPSFIIPPTAFFSSTSFPEPPEHHGLWKADPHIPHTFLRALASPVLRSSDIDHALANSLDTLDPNFLSLRHTRLTSDTDSARLALSQRILLDMLKNSIQPFARSWTLVLRDLARLGRTQDVEAILRGLEARAAAADSSEETQPYGTGLDALTYLSTAKGYLVSRKYNEAKEMLMKGLELEMSHDVKAKYKEVQARLARTSKPSTIGSPVRLRY